MKVNVYLVSYSNSGVEFYDINEYYYNLLFLLMLKIWFLRLNGVYPEIWIGYETISFRLDTIYSVKAGILAFGSF